MRRFWLKQHRLSSLLVAGILTGVLGATQPPDPIVPIIAAGDTPAGTTTFDRTLIGSEPVTPLLGSGRADWRAEARNAPWSVLVTGQQIGRTISDPLFVTPATQLTWSWQKRAGTVIIVQVQLKNPETGQTRYLGYAAGVWTEQPSADPTVEYFLSNELPRTWTACVRNLYDDMQALLGWTSAQITEVYLSPWDGEPGEFRAVDVTAVSDVDTQALRKARELDYFARIGTGHYAPLPLKRYEDRRVDRFETSFEECAPGRNSGANEWTAFGVPGKLDFNAIGRDLHVRYPLCDLVFRLDSAGREVKPDELPSFRLGLVAGRLPAVWGGWQHDGLLYKVSVMTVPSAEHGAFDLYKLEVQNRGDAPRTSGLVAVLEGAPDMRLEHRTVRGLGAAPLLVADPPRQVELVRRDWGLCDKRAKAYATGPGPGPTEPAVSRYRLGLDGLPVVYRCKAEADAEYLVYLVATPHIAGHLVEKPQAPGDLVWQYHVEGCPSQTVDYIPYLRAKNQPITVRFEQARDADGDGYLEVRAGVDEASRVRHTRLSAIYVFPADTAVASDEAVFSGSLNDKCLWHIDVGATPEQGPTNQLYDKTDVGFARLRLHYSDPIPPGMTKTYWLKVPPIHRREPVSMGYIAHAFRDVLPGEAVPPYSAARLTALDQCDPGQAEQQTRDYWNEFFTRAPRLELPDQVLVDIFLSRLATRAVLDVQIAPDVVYNTCSPFFYFDHAYRDQAYVIYALDLAGMHDRAARLLRVYCMDVADVPPGPIAFDGRPLQLGMLPDGLWYTRPGQFDTQGQNLWALVQHYKLSGDRMWLAETAYPYVRRGAMWLVNSRHKHMAEVQDPADPRYGLIEPGGMEVLEVGQGMHMFYMNGFAILGLREAADAAGALGRDDDAQQFAAEAADLQRCLLRAFQRTFKRTGLYEGHLWFGIEPQGVGMYGFWAHNCLVWPCRCIDAHHPLLSATWRKMERMSDTWGGGLHSEAEGSFWPYIGADRAVSYLLRGEPERALDYFCAFTDTAGGTLSWGEGYSHVIAGGDQPHFWADGQWLNLFRQLFVFEDGHSLWLTPALFRRWHAGGHRVQAAGLATHFGRLDLDIVADDTGDTLEYRIRIAPQGDQAARPLDKLVLYPRIADGRPVRRVVVDGQPQTTFSHNTVVVAAPPRDRLIQIVVEAGSW